MEGQLHAVPTSASSPRSDGATVVEPSLAEKKAKRLFIIGLSVVGLFLVGLIVLLVLLSIDAYQAAHVGGPPSPGAVVVSLLRDAAIIFVAFETLVIGILLIVLMLQVHSLVVLLRDEVKPMLQATNETLATVRGTTQFVSHNVVSPVVKWSGYWAGFRAILQEIAGLREMGKREE